VAGDSGWPVARRPAWLCGSRLSGAPSPTGSIAIVAPVDVLMEQASAAASRLSTTIALEESDGRRIWGETPPAGASSHGRAG
jgi:hypothetical protein